MRKTYVIIILTLLASLTTVSQADDFGPASNKMIKAAHYFADAWPITFWQEFEAAHVESDIQRIKRDGFNTVILAVPWLGFETDFSTQMTKSDPRLYDRLDFLLRKFSEAGMKYILRVGYSHDFTPGLDKDPVQLCLDLYAENRTLIQWKSYLRKLKRVTNQHREALGGILVSWEDFWCVHAIFPHKTEDRRRQVAAELRYGQWLMTQDQDIVRLLMGENEIPYDQLAIPKKDEPSYYFYMKFTREILDERILPATQSVFPQAAMEIRVDRDPVESHQGKIWIENNLFLDEKNRRGTYWAPFWGARNEAEQLTTDQALANIKNFLTYVSADGTATNHLIDQFNFYDNTPHYPNHAHISVSSVPAFLERVAPLIKQYSAGYGVWAYQDYVDNVLYNASFEFDLNGWATQGDVGLLKGVGENRLSLKKGSRIAQRFQPGKRFMLDWVYEELTFCFCSDTEGEAVISESGETLVEVDVMPGQNCHVLDALPITGKKEARFGIQAVSDLVIDDLKLYGFVQSLGLYDEFGQPGNFLEATRRLNGNLETPANPGKYTHRSAENHLRNQCSSPNKL